MNGNRSWTRLLALSLTALLFGACSRPAPRLPVEPQRTVAWSDEVVAELAEVPVQDNGRVKPLSVFAAFTLYNIHGRRDLKYTTTGADGLPQKVTLTPTEWLLDSWCYPVQAANYPLFRIENVAVLDALGFANEGQKQGFEWLSYAQLTEPTVIEKLQELANAYRRIERKDRSAVQEHIVTLWGHLLAYDDVFGELRLFGPGVEVRGEPMRTALGGESASIGDLLRKAVQFRAAYEAAGGASSKDEDVVAMMAHLNQVFRWNAGPGLIPPLRDQDGADEWRQPGFAIERALLHGAGGGLVELLVGLQAAVTGEDHATKERGLVRYAEAVDQLAGVREDVSSVGLEDYYYRLSWHYQAIHWFLFAFVLAAVSWTMPKRAWIWWASIAVTMLALGMLGLDLTLRCMVTGRPPIKNLYDTFLFIGFVGVALAVVAEFILRRRIALAVAPVFGALLIMFARMFEVSDGRDTMDPLQAVLDSNFWLATHVTSINIGYGAGLIAAMLANVWIYMRVFRLAHPQSAEAKALVRTVYGVTCFGLMFAVVGTILGGVWANDSWGRFWGWDPKENGALLICLSQIALLHARFSGWVRDFGFIAWSSITGMVVVFSWFHTNLLGIGLHSYGFSSGLRDAVWTLYIVQMLTVAAGVIDMLLRPAPAGAPGSPEAEAKRAEAEAKAAVDAAWPATNQ